jgi:hypothetical protein
MWDSSTGSFSDAKGLYRAGGVVGDVDRDEYAERGPWEDISRQTRNLFHLYVSIGSEAVAP